MKSVETPPKDKKINKKLLTVGALGFSLIFHFGLLLFTGGIVLIQGIIPKPSFMVAEPIVDTPTITEEAVEDTAAHEEANGPLPPDSIDLTAPAEVNQPTAPTMEAPIIPSVVTTQNVNAMQNTIAVPTPSQTSSQTPEKPSPNKTNTAAVRTMSSLFGSKGEESDAMVGYFYDLKQTSERRDNELAEDPKADKAYLEAKAKFDADKKPGLKAPEMPEMGKNLKYVEIVNDFLKNWDIGVLSKYYKSPSPLSSYQMFIPMMAATEAPKAFDVERQVKPRRWVIYYKGTFVAPKSGTFRFVGMADDVLVVRFDKKVVLNASLAGLKTEVTRDILDPSAAFNRQVAGPWIRMSEGQSYPIEMLLGELPGGVFYAFLTIEEKGVTYPKRPTGGSILPIFQMAPTKIPKFDPKTSPPFPEETFSGKA